MKIDHVMFTDDELNYREKGHEERESFKTAKRILGEIQQSAPSGFEHYFAGLLVTYASGSFPLIELATCTTLVYQFWSARKRQLEELFRDHYHVDVMVMIHRPTVCSVCALRFRITEETETTHGDDHVHD